MHRRPPSRRIARRNLLSLNCRGVGQPKAVHEIRSLLQLHRPALVFLSETKVSDRRVQELKWRFGFDRAFGLRSEGRSGGLALFWNNDSSVILKSFSKSHINVLVKND